MYKRQLPKRFDDRRVQEALAPEKDVDGITDGSMAGVFTNMPIGYPPCTAQACLEILKYYNVPLSGKRAVVVGRSLVVGKPCLLYTSHGQGAAADFGRGCYCRAEQPDAEPDCHCDEPVPLALRQR